MTQDATSAEQGDVSEVGQGLNPPTDKGSANGPQNYADILALGLRPEAEAGDEEEPDDEDESADGEDEETDEGDESDEGEGEPEETPKPGAQPQKETVDPAEAMASWIEKVATNPKSINEIPAKHHPAVFERVLVNERQLQQDAAVAAYEQGISDGAARLQRQMQLEQAEAEVDALQEDDPARYVAWRREHPDRAKIYDQVKEAKDPRNRRAAPSDGSLPDAAFAPIVVRLQQYPAAFARVEARMKAEPTKYLRTAQGLGEFTDLVAEEIAAERSGASKPKPPTPAERALEQRQAAAANRKGLPKTSAVGGARGGDSPTRLSNDPKELLAQGFRQERDKIASR